jgi:hypothetical protein
MRRGDDDEPVATQQCFRMLLAFVCSSGGFQEGKGGPSSKCVRLITTVPKYKAVPSRVGCVCLLLQYLL